MERKLSLLGLDYGEATVGVAASDGLFLTAQPLEVIRRNRGKQLRETVRRIEEIARERFATYFKETAPLIKFYEDKGVLYKIDANGSIEEVWNRLLDVVNC